ncbi:helix-turn-helix domain-containing protein [Tritonibacter mobilis]|uniref:helix-turn-helix domain-containing protein n=1 Tax=Tritonibacter mobilis TaxID=379347 RepID=UPI003D2DA621
MSKRDGLAVKPNAVFTTTAVKHPFQRASKSYLELVRGVTGCNCCWAPYGVLSIVSDLERLNDTQSSLMIDIQRLAILREIERTGSLIDAADRLNLTQSAVCHAMRRFE